MDALREDWPQLCDEVCWNLRQSQPFASLSLKLCACHDGWIIGLSRRAVSWPSCAKITTMVLTGFKESYSPSVTQLCRTCVRGNIAPTMSCDLLSPSKKHIKENCLRMLRKHESRLAFHVQLHSLQDWLKTKLASGQSLKHSLQLWCRHSLWLVSRLHARDVTALSCTPAHMLSWMCWLP